MEKLEYSFIRGEKNNDFVVFLKINPEWLDQDITIDLNNNKISLESKNIKYYSEEISPPLLERLNSQPTPFIFTNINGDFLMESVLNFQPKISKPKI